MDKKIEENKIIYTNNILKTIKSMSKIKDTIVLTPLTNIEDLLNLRSSNILKKIIETLMQENKEFINNDYLLELTNDINIKLGLDLIDYEIPNDKLIKFFFKEQKIQINFSIIPKLIKIFEKYSLKNINIIISGFDNNTDIIQSQYSHVNLILITNTLVNIGLNWINIELVEFDTKEEFKIENKELLLNWLELDIKSVLRISDVCDYLNGNISMNSFLIERSLKKL